MPDRAPEAAEADRVRAVRDAFAAALRGDFDSISAVLAEDVRWHGAGEDDGGGCRTRDEALVWMGEAVARGVRVEVLDVRALDENRVLVLLQRHPPRDPNPTGELPPRHGQIVRFRDGKVSEIVVYASDDQAIQAAGSV